MALSSRNAPSPVAGGAPTRVAGSWWRRTGFLSALDQAALVAAVCLAGWWLYGNLVDNLTRTRIPTNFDFLTQPTGFAIPENFGFDPSLPIWRMTLIGVQNTLLAGLVGVLLASIVGLVVGIARLSSNWLVARMAQVFVEGFRNTPPLVVIVFFSFAVFSFGPLPVFPEALDLKLPGLRQQLAGALQEPDRDPESLRGAARGAGSGSSWPAGSWRPPAYGSGEAGGTSGPVSRTTGCSGRSAPSPSW